MTTTSTQIDNTLQIKVEYPEFVVNYAKTEGVFHDFTIYRVTESDVKFMVGDGINIVVISGGVETHKNTQFAQQIMGEVIHQIVGGDVDEHMRKEVVKCFELY